MCSLSSCSGGDAAWPRGASGGPSARTCRQSTQLNGLAPVCVLAWYCRFCLRGNLRWQTSHSNGLSPRWMMRMCELRLPVCWNRLWQYLHSRDLRLEVCVVLGETVFDAMERGTSLCSCELSAKGTPPAYFAKPVGDARRRRSRTATRSNFCVIAAACSAHLKTMRWCAPKTFRYMRTGTLRSMKLPLRPGKHVSHFFVKRQRSSSTRRPTQRGQTKSLARCSLRVEHSKRQWPKQSLPRGAVGEEGARVHFAFDSLGCVE